MTTSSPACTAESIDANFLLQRAIASYAGQDWDSARALCRQILLAFPTHFDALHLLGSIQLQSSHFDEALELLSRAAVQQPANPTIENKLGIVCTQLRLETRALGHFEAALTADPHMAEAFVGRGALLDSLGRTEAAIADHRRAIELRPDFAMAHLLLGHCLVQVGRAQDGTECYDRVLALAPGSPEALHAKGNALRDIGKEDEAAAAYEAALQADSRHQASLGSLGDLLVQLGRHEAALAILDRLLRLRPDHVNALVLRGQVRLHSNKLVEATQDFKRALDLNPELGAAYVGVGGIQIKAREFEAAAASMRRAIELGSDQDIAAHLGLSQALRAMGFPDEAARSVDRARELSPQSPLVWYCLADLQLSQRQLKAAAASFQHACELKPDFADAHSSLLFTLNFLPEVSDVQRLLEAQRWNDKCTSQLQASAFVHVKPKDHKRRLRLGYVSSDFRNHAVANFMAPVLAHHTKQFELLGYHCSPLRDDVTRALARRFKQFRYVEHFSAEALAHQIHADGVDVLVDLSGHTDGNRLTSFALRPAPVQVTYLGYPGTTGLATMDYRISDCYADPEGADSLYTETLLRLPNSLWCYQPRVGMPHVGPLPALERGHLTLGSFNSFGKVDHRSLALWGQLLHAVPEAHLVMATLPHGSVRDEILHEFASMGVSPDRIKLLGPLKLQEFWQQLERVDISLDPVSVNGATTTCESLWLGVPVLSRVGARFLERAGLSILSSAGLQEFCCDSDDACVALVQSLANDLPRLAALRAGMRAKVYQSPLMDAGAFTRELESLYMQAWDRWASGGESR